MIVAEFVVSVESRGRCGGGGVGASVGWKCAFDVCDGECVVDGRCKGSVWEGDYHCGRRMYQK